MSLRNLEVRISIKASLAGTMQLCVVGIIRFLVWNEKEWIDRWWRCWRWWRIIWQSWWLLRGAVSVVSEAVDTKVAKRTICDFKPWGQGYTGVGSWTLKCVWGVTLCFDFWPIKVTRPRRSMFSNSQYRHVFNRKWKIKSVVLATLC